MKENKLSEATNSKLLASYMTGFLEADGCIHGVLNKNKTEVIRYEIKFSFSKKDKKFAELLQETFKIGKVKPHAVGLYVVKEEKNAYSCSWSITKAKEVLNFLVFLNGYFRTAKIGKLQQAFEFFNLKYHLSLELKPLNTSSFLEDSWFAGFSDGDSSFQVREITQKEKKKTTLYLYYLLEQVEIYPKFVGTEFEKLRDSRSFMEPLSKAFSALLNFCKRGPASSPKKKGEDKNRKSFKDRSSIKLFIRSVHLNSLILYFSKNPLFSSKYLDFEDWKLLYNLKNQHNNLFEFYETILKIRGRMNSYRTLESINWGHLSNFYSLPLDYPNIFIPSRVSKK